MKRARLLKELRRKKRIAEIIGVACGFIAVFLMGGVDGKNWIPVLIAMFLFMGMAFIASVVADEYGYRISNIMKYEPWQKGVWR